MDADSIGDRLKDIQTSKVECVENANESMEEVPKILSPELDDVFHVFANMLDVKSFMKLAVTSKKMYKRCMENKEIKIPLDVHCLNIMNENGSVDYDFSFNAMLPDEDDNYNAALLKVPCKVNMHMLQIWQDPVVTMESLLARFREMGLNKIDELSIHYHLNEWDVVITMIKEFHVNSLNIHRPVETDILRSIFQLNLKKLHYNDPIPVKSFLDSPIPEFSLPGIRNISSVEVDDIVWEFRWRCLRRLTIGANAVDWKAYDPDLIPEGGPMFFSYWSGPMIKIKTNGITRFLACELPEKYHYFHFIKDEDVMKYLAEKWPVVSCSSEHFHTFFAGFTTIDRSHNGPLPENRPLCFILSENHYWMLDENENLMECSWKDDEATWKGSAPLRNEILSKIEHPSLAKCRFWALLKQFKEHDHYLFKCEGLEEFDSWFDDFEMLDFDYSGPLPSSRPLVFKGCSSWEEEGEEELYRIVLLDDDRLLLCHFYRFGRISDCRYLSRPPILLTAKNVMEILQDPDHENMSFNISFDTFRGGVELLKKPILFFQKRLLISEKTETEVWYRIEATVRKVVWEDGHLSISEDDLREAPPDFTKQVFRRFAENSWTAYLTMELDQFRNCLEQFTVVLFDYSGPLTSDLPMAFVKNEIRHTCDEESTCQCSEVSSILVWFLWNGTMVTICLWRKGGQEGPYTFCIETSLWKREIPPMLKSKDILKNLLQAKYSETSVFEWLGEFEDFLTNCKDFVKLPFEHDGPLPEERPLLFSSDKENAVFLLREDGSIIKCERQLTTVYFSLVSPNVDKDVPTALKNML